MRHFDAHNHLQDERLAPHLPRVIADLEKLGIAGAVVNGTIDTDWADVARLAREHPWVIPSYGVHPWMASKRAPDWEDQLNKRLDEGGMIGEIGLDHWKEGLDLDDQAELFRAQLRMAAQRNRAATIHCLRAWGPLWDIIRSEPVPARGFLFHAYGGPVEMVEGFAQHGAYFSFNAHFLAKGKEKKLDPFRTIPLDRLLVETDAPAMSVPPEKNHYPLPDSPDGNRINHPANLAAAYAALASLRGINVEKLAITVEANFFRLFGEV
jgi:TatD DNase family protein